MTLQGNPVWTGAEGGDIAQHVAAASSSNPITKSSLFCHVRYAKKTKVVVERVHAKHAGGITQRTELFFFSDDACFQFTRNDR